MRRSVFTLLVAASISLASSASAQETAHPFGLTFGTSLADMKKLIPGLTKTETMYTYAAPSVPTPYPGFEAYGFFISPTHGLCRVAAMGATIEDDRYGTETRSDFSALQEALTTKYGEPLVVDSLIAATSLNGPEYWAYNLSENARVFAAVWPKGDGPLGFGLNAIKLEAEGISMSSTFLSLMYDGDNIEACREEVKDAL